MTTYFSGAGESNRRRLVAVFDWLGSLDTRIVEFGCALRLGQLAAAVTSYDSAGRSAAPYLSNALLAFDSSSIVMLSVLSILGVLQMAALAHGTFPKRRGFCERFGWRCMVSTFSTAICGFIVLTMMGLGQPFAVVWGYSLAVILNGFDAVVLWVKHEDARDAKDCVKQTARKRNTECR